MASMAYRSVLGKRAKQVLRRLSREGRGQSTVEFALVTAALLVVFVGLGALWRVFSEGVVVEHAVAAAPYHVQGGQDLSVADVFAA